MDQLLRIKDSFLNYLSPVAKRRRTIDPSTPDTREHAFLASYSDPQDKKAHVTAISRLNLNYKPGFKSPRKRAREDDNDSISFSAIDPDDSISRGSPMDEDGSDGTTGSEEESEDGDEDALGSEEEDMDDDDDRDMEDEGEAEISAEDKVAQYLARQAELEERLKDVEAFKLTGKHKDEIFLFERMSMRGFEELLPADWQIDFPTLPMVLFTGSPGKTFINDNCISQSRGKKTLNILRRNHY
jgi:hypothetical protein